MCEITSLVVIPAVLTICISRDRKLGVRWNKTGHVGCYILQSVCARLPCLYLVPCTFSNASTASLEPSSWMETGGKLHQINRRMYAIILRVKGQ